MLVYPDAAAYEVEFTTMTGDRLGVETLRPDRLRTAGAPEVLHSRAIA